MKSCRKVCKKFNLSVLESQYSFCFADNKGMEIKFFERKKIAATSVLDSCAQ